MSATAPQSPPSGTTTPPQPSPSSSYLSYPVSRVVSGLYRRLTDPSATSPPKRRDPPPRNPSSPDMNGVFQPVQRTASPFSPPPLTGLSLTGVKPSTSSSAQILTKMLAEEIRLLLPPRLQLSTDWNLAYSIEQDGVSLATLYSKCQEHKSSRRGGFVLVVKDSVGGVSFTVPPAPVARHRPIASLISHISNRLSKTPPADAAQIFGAFLTDPPHPSSHYYGTGECFLWRASVLPAAALLANLPPPPSADTTNLQRSTTIAAATRATSSNPHSGQPSPAVEPKSRPPPDLLTGSDDVEDVPQGGSLSPPPALTPSGLSTPDRIRFKAFPYSGVNDYVLFCESDYLSVGGGDGRYGLWLDSSLEHGVSMTCMTFGNESLSEEGDKFDILGVEVWGVGG